ncbi:MAG: Flp pilus assembly protein CpaB [Firmicutes bacterium]|nr:Flp pilus assembly protein CpaB [Bacillota bacterium]
MNARNVAVAVALGVAAATSSMSYLRGLERSQLEHWNPTPVVVATSNIPVRTPLTKPRLALRNMPGALVPPGAATSLGQVAGRYAGSTIHAGEVVLLSRVTGDGSETGLAVRVPPGMRAIGIEAEGANFMAGLIQPGDRIDLLLMEEDGVGEGSPGFTTLSGVPVLAVGRRSGEEEAAGGRDTVSPPGYGAQDALSRSDLVTVAVSPEDAARIFAGEQRGALRVVLRSLQEPMDDVPSGTEGRLRPKPKQVASRKAVGSSPRAKSGRGVAGTGGDMTAREQMTGRLGASGTGGDTGRVAGTALFPPGKTVEIIRGTEAETVIVASVRLGPRVP